MHTGVVLFRLLWVAQVGSYAGTNSPFLDSKKEFKKKDIGVNTLQLREAQIQRQIGGHVGYFVTSSGQLTVPRDIPRIFDTSSTRPVKMK